MDGMLSTRIAQYDIRYLEDMEFRLAFHAGGYRALESIEAAVTGPVNSLPELVCQYEALHMLATICRAVSDEFEDYSETAYCADNDENGVASIYEEATLRIAMHDLLDERFAYVRAIYGKSVLTT